MIWKLLYKFLLFFNVFGCSKIEIFAINVVYYNYVNELMWRSKQTFLVFLSFSAQVFLLEIKSISSETTVDTVLAVLICREIKLRNIFVSSLSLSKQLNFLFGPKIRLLHRPLSDQGRISRDRISSFTSCANKFRLGDITSWLPRFPAEVRSDLRESFELFC